MKCVNGDAEYRSIAIDGIEISDDSVQGSPRKDRS